MVLNCHFADFLWHQLYKSSCHFVTVPVVYLLFCQLAVLPTCCFANLPFCQLAISLACHLVNVLLHQLYAYLLIFNVPFFYLPFCQLTGRYVDSCVCKSSGNIALLDHLRHLWLQLPVSLSSLLRWNTHIFIKSAFSFSPLTFVNLLFCLLAISFGCHLVGLVLYQTSAKL